MNTVRLFSNGCPSTSCQLTRLISTSSVNCNMKNFNKFRLLNRGTEFEKRRQKESPDRTIPFWSHGVRHPGDFIGNRFVLIPEAVPEIIVPDLSDCQFKPYVSYRTPEIVQEEFTAEDLFEAVYSAKVEKDYNENKLDEDGNSLEPNEDELMTAEQAYIKARQTGSDYFCQDRPFPTRAERLNLD